MYVLEFHFYNAIKNACRERERGSAHVEKLIRLRKQEQEKEAIDMVNQIVVNIIFFAYTALVNMIINFIDEISQALASVSHNNLILVVKLKPHSIKSIQVPQ